MIQNLFSIPIWKKNILITPSIRKNILNQVENSYAENKNIFAKDNFWNCNVCSSYFSEDHIDYSSLLCYFKNEYEEFCKDLNLYNHSYRISNIWFNYYLKGYNQECHNHVSSKETTAFSAVYFLKLNQSHPKITFFNTSNIHIYYHSNENLLNIHDTKNIKHSFCYERFEYDVVENDFIIFPSFLSHEVPIQKNDDARITISLNFSV